MPITESLCTFCGHRRGQHRSSYISESVSYQLTDYGRCTAPNCQCVEYYGIKGQVIRS